MTQMLHGAWIPFREMKFPKILLLSGAKKPTAHGTICVICVHLRPTKPLPLLRPSAVICGSLAPRALTGFHNTVVRNHEHAVTQCRTDFRSTGEVSKRWQDAKLT